jgi:hypothetical protein
MGEIDRTAGRNPYEPPKATLADIVPSTTEIPGRVVAAVRLIWLSLVLGAVSTAVFSIHPPPGKSIVGVMGLVGFGLLVAVVLNLAIRRGKNWARIVFVVLFVIGFLLGIPRLAVLWKAPSVFLVSEELQDILQLVSVILLLTEPATRWFKLSSATKE